MLPLTRGSRRWWNQESAATVVWGQEMADSGARRPDPVHAEPFPVRSGPFGGNVLPLTRVSGSIVGRFGAVTQTTPLSTGTHPLKRATGGCPKAPAGAVSLPGRRLPLSALVLATEQVAASVSATPGCRALQG